MSIQRLSDGIRTGFHEFFRYGIPGYTFIVVVLVFFLSAGNTHSIDTTLMAVIAILSGLPIGFFPYQIYYYYIHYRDYMKMEKDKECNYRFRSPTYQVVWKFIREEVQKRIQKEKDEKLKKEWTEMERELKENKGKIELLTRCLWDDIFFSKEFPKESRERILFLFTMIHSIGSILVAIWLGIGVGIYVSTILFLNSFSIVKICSTSLLTISLLVLSIFLYKCPYRKIFRKLAIHEEAYAAVNLEQKIKEKAELSKIKSFLEVS